VSADFFSIAVVLDDADAAELLPELRAAETEYNGNVYVDMGDELIELVEEAPSPVISASFGVFVGLDRFAADRRLLDGHAFRWVALPELARFRALVDDVVRAAGGRDAAIERVAREIGGEDDAAAGLDALYGGIDEAERVKRGLLLLCLPV
jgi:hypothetical protein